MRQFFNQMARRRLQIKRQRLRICLKQLRMRCSLTSTRIKATVENTLIPLNERPFFCLCIGIITGILISVKLPFTLLHLVSILILCLTFTLHWASPQLAKSIRIFVAGLLLSHLSVMWRSQALPLDHISRFVNSQPIRTVTIEGNLYRPVERHGTYQRLYVRLHRLYSERQWRVVRGQARLNLHAEEAHFLPGDVLRIRHLRLYPIRGFLNPGAFDFRTYMHRRHIYAVGGISQPARIQLLYRPPHIALRPLLERWRRSLRSQLRQSLTAPAYPTFMAMIFGQRGILPAQQIEDFRIAGTAHLLVVSGLHVGFVATLFFLVWRTLFRLLTPYLPLTWRPTPLAIALSLPEIIFYCSVVGWQVSTLRAAVMVGSSLIALAIGRLRELPYAIAFAAIVLCLSKPLIIFSLGFQLSFVAVSCIALVLYSHRYKPTSTTPANLWWQRVRIYLVVSVAAYLGTLPILARAFHSIPVYGLFANLLLVPLAGIIVPYGLIFLGIIAIFPQLMPIFSWPLNMLLTIMSNLAAAIAALPNAQLHLPAPSLGMFISYYGLLGFFFLSTGWRRRLLGAGLCLAALIATIGLQYFSTQYDQLRITFLDVGSGDAIMIQVPGRHTLLIDGGGTYDGRFDIGARVIAPVLWDQYINRLAFMAMTHPQSNHARGLVGVMRYFPTDHLMTNGTPLDAPYLHRLLVLGQKWGTQHHTPASGPRQWQWGQLTLTLLAPPSPSEQASTAWQPPTENDKSLVFRLQYGNISVLLTGDIQKSTEQWLVKHRNVQADILQIPHHGSRTSSSAEFLRRVKPRAAIISPGANNRYGHPHARVLRDLHANNIRIFRTDKHGAITITTDGTHYNIVPLLPSPPPS